MKKFGLSLILCLLVLSNALAQWSDNPFVNSQVTTFASEQTIPKIAVGPSGDYYIGYFSSEGGNYNMRLQRYDYEGNMLWTQNGILVSNHLQMSWLTDWDMSVDHENHAVLTWQDIRSGGNNNVVAYRISPDGDFVWGADGIMLSNSSNFDVSPKVAITAANNAVFAWQSENDIIIQKLNPSGTKQWGESGITLTTSNRYSWPQLMPVGQDDVIMKFFEDSGPVNAPTRHILAQRFNASGSPVWFSNTVISNAGGISAWTQILPMVNDGNDGFYIAWHEDRNMTNRSHPYIQYVNVNGAVQYTANGLLLATDSHMNHFYPNIAKPDNDEHVYIYWNKLNDLQTQWGIFGQKVTANGTKLWPDVGLQIIPVSGNAVLPQFAIGLASEMVLIYEDYFDGVQTAIKAMRLKSNGEQAWDGGSIALSSVVSSKMHLDDAALFNNQMVFAWGDNRNGNQDIYAQNLHSNGSLGLIETNGFINGTVSFYNGTADPALTLISAGGEQVQADENGNFSIELAAGTYTLEATHPYTNDFLMEEVIVEAGQTTQVEVEMEVVRTDVHVYAINQYNAPIIPTQVQITGPEGTYNALIEDDYYTFENLPYGHYEGTATHMDIVIEADTLINGENNMLVFLFVDVGISTYNEPDILKIMPNPIRPYGLLTIQSEMNAQYLLYIYDEKGSPITSGKQLMLKKGVNMFELNELFNNWEKRSGLYFFRFEHANRSVIRKIIIFTN